MTSTKTTRPAALAVAAGILLSRVSGLVRERVFAHYLGNSEAAGAFKAALRIPNLLQNLLGEGVLSASFIPAYAQLRSKGELADARRLAQVTFTALLLVVSTLAGLGVMAAPALTELVAPGFQGETHTLTVQLVRIMFPGVGVLVLSAWCLGVQNAHRKFFLSYVAPVLWNAAQVAALVMAAITLIPGTATGEVSLTLAAAWGTVAGAGLQLLLQLGPTLRLVGGFGLSLARTRAAKQVLTSLAPVVVARGVVQISAYVDQVLASLIGASAVSAISYAQQLYLLPISLFGMSISAAALPELSSMIGSKDEVLRALSARLVQDRARMAFFVVPSTVALVVVGDALVALLFQSGRFLAGDTALVWTILIGLAWGLPAATEARLLSSVFYALADTKTPLRTASIRVGASAVLGTLVAWPLRQRLDLAPSAAAALLTASSALAAWLEWWTLRRALERRLGAVPPNAQSTRLWLAAAAAGGSALAFHRAMSSPHPIFAGLGVVLVFSVVYGGASLALGISQASELRARLTPGLSRLLGRPSRR